MQDFFNWDTNFREDFKFSANCSGVLAFFFKIEGGKDVRNDVIVINNCYLILGKTDLRTDGHCVIGIVEKVK